MNAPFNSQPARAEQLARMRELVSLLEAGDDAGFEARFSELIGVRTQFLRGAVAKSDEIGGNWVLTPINSQGLFVSVARLTRDLHDAVRGLSFDEHLSTLAGREIPDACSRLDYVTRVTEEAAHKTLDLVEQCQQLTQDIVLAAHDISTACHRAHIYAGSPYSLSGLVVSVDETRDHVVASAASLRDRLSQLAQAQEYQDLAGQVIKKVTTLVRSVERALIDLLRASGGAVSARPSDVAANHLHGPAVAGVTPLAVSQDDADSLLADLGF